MTVQPLSPRYAGERSWSPDELVVAGIAFGLAVVAIATRTTRPSSTAAFVAAVLFFIVVPGGYIALSVGGARQWVSSLVTRLGPLPQLLAGPMLLLVLTSSYALAAGLPVAVRLGSYAPYLLVPPLLLAVPRPAAGAAARAPLPELALVLALWLPIEFRLLPPLPVPVPNGVDMRKLVGLVDAMYLFLVARPLQRIGYTYRLTWRDAASAVGAFLVYALVALPVGFATGFIAWHPRLDATHLLGGPFIIYLVTGVPEEFLFRGLLQNLLVRWVGERTGWVIASIVFGFAHLPDPRYVLLAAIAGLAYGWVYRRTEKITASAITHALVDATWVVLLGG